jgi:phospholipid-binding lipoprotein MlaA
MALSGIRTLTMMFVGVSVMLSGCARNPTNAEEDPLEGYNRLVFAFNQDVDHLALRPAAKIYRAITPTPLQKGVTNFFANIDELPTFANDILQGNFRYLGLDFWRFAVNSTVGIGGLFDVASRIGMPKHSTTFGLTLAKWRGGKPSAYFMIPLLGASTIQNGIGLVADSFARPWYYIDNDTVSYTVYGVQAVNKRSRLLDADKMVETAFDPYVFVRDAYMQQVRLSIQNNDALEMRDTPHSNY